MFLFSDKLPHVFLFYYISHIISDAIIGSDWNF